MTIHQNKYFNFLRLLITLACVPVLTLTGWRFGRIHRNTENLVYLFIDTVRANEIADRD
jgi:hypothetical protein